MSNKPKILVVSNVPMDNGGVQAVIMNIARNLSIEYTFDILLLTDKKSYCDEAFEELGGKIFRTSGKKGPFWSRVDYYLRAGRVYRKIRKIIRENGPYSAVHCHCQFEAGLCLAAAKKAGVPIRVAHTHIIHQRVHIVSRIYNACYRFLIEKHATHKLGCSSLANESFYKNFADASVVNNPYSAEKFLFEGYPQAELSCPSLVQVGSFSKNKNQLFSLEVIAEIKKQYPKVRFDMVGFDLGGILNEIKEKISDLGLEENVTIHPSDANTPEILARSCGCLFPSKKEGFGIVAIEAQAMGVKCFASDTVPRSTDCGGCEYLPLSAGAKVWAEKIIEDFKATGGKHKKYDCSAFEAKRIAEEYRKIYGN